MIEDDMVPPEHSTAYTAGLEYGQNTEKCALPINPYDQELDHADWWWFNTGFFDGYKKEQNNA